MAPMAGQIRRIHRVAQRKSSAIIHLLTRMDSAPLGQSGLDHMLRNGVIVLPAIQLNLNLNCVRAYFDVKSLVSPTRHMGNFW
jgi:hypothetical protein